jgi:epoxyqueuosine reductase
MLPSGALKVKARELGFVAVGVAAADADAAARFIFHERIDLGMYEGLPWFTHERADRATEPARALHGAASVITLAAPYKQEHSSDEVTLGLRGRVARYAWGRDYHRVLEKRLQRLTAFVEQEYDGRSRGLVDYGPLAERAYAARAGIGWFGKSTNLLLPGVGSWVLLAELVTTVAFAPDAPLKKSCGTCTRCVGACPTGAISGAYVVDNQRCISFQTIENRGWIPRPLRPLMGDWVFGCDLCQDACPVGAGGEAVSLPEFAPADLDAALPELTALLRLTEDEFLGRFQGRAVMRAKRAGLARNACVALGNLGNPEATQPLGLALTGDPAATVRGHAAWALGRIGGTEARRLLEAAGACETDVQVREEIEAALGDCPTAPHGAGILTDRTAWLTGPWKRSGEARRLMATTSSVAGQGGILLANRMIELQPDNGDTRP